MSDLQDITPDDSAVPVFLDPTLVPAVREDRSSPTEVMAAQDALRASAVAKLAALGLTEAEARAITG